MTNHDIPRTSRQITSLAGEVLHSIVKQYEADGRSFVDSQSGQTGLIYRCAGPVSLLLLVNGFADLSLPEECRNVIIREFSEARQYAAKNGYDASPFLEPTLTKLFSPKAPKRYHYLDSVSWFLSFALHLRLASRSGRIEMSKEDLKAVDEVVKETLQIVAMSACKEGGWGFSSGCLKPDLYYSYAVSESLADFGDYVMGETPEVARADEELQAFLGQELVGNVEDVRRRTADWLIKTHLPRLGEQAVPPEGAGTGQQGDRHRLLYYTFFVLDMLVVNKADEFFSEISEDIRSGIEHAIYLSRIDLDRARKDRDWWENVTESSLPLRWENFENSALIPGRHQGRLFEPGLVPLSLRCNALYAYYIAGGEDRKVDDLFQLVYSNRRSDNGLWDTDSYSLMVTERAIEALVDYNDYVVKFRERVQPESIGAGTPSGIEQAFRSVVREEVEACLKNDRNSSQSKQGIAALVGERTGPELSENDLLDLLTSALAMGSMWLQGKESPGVQLEFDEERFRRFCAALDDFLFTRVTQQLLKTAGGGTSPPKLEEQVRGGLASLIDRYAIWLAQDPRLTLGDLLSWAVKEASTKQESMAMASQMKPTPRGTK